MVEATSLTEAWTRAMNRALARGVDVDLVSSERIGYDVQTRYRTSSTSQPGTAHYVLVSYTGAGVQVQCDCPGGSAGNCCAHAAACLLREGWLPFRPVPQPVTATNPPEPKPITLMGRRELQAYLASCEVDPQFG